MAMTMKAISRLALFCLGLALLLALTACKEQEDIPLPAKEAVVLNVAESRFYFDYEKAYVERFEELYPHITINIVPDVPQPGYTACPEEVRPSCSEFNEVDVFTLTSGYVESLGELGVMKDLSVLMYESKTFDPEDMVPDVQDAFKAHGDIVGIPIGMRISAIYYNKDLLDAYQVAYPQSGWTWEEFLETAQALTHRDDCIYAFEPTTYPFWLTGSESYLHNTEQGVVPTINTGERIRAFERYTSLVYDYNVIPTLEQLRACANLPGVDQYNVSQWAINHGQLAMWHRLLVPVSQTYRLGSQWPENLGVVPAPVQSDYHTVAQSLGLAISATSKHPEVAWQWVEFVSHNYIESLYLPVRASILFSDVYMQDNGHEHVAVIRKALENGQLEFTFDGVEPDEKVFEAEAIYNEAVESILNGELSPSLALDHAQEEAEAVLFAP